MEQFFSRHFWVVKTLGVATIAGLAASAAMTTIGTSLALDVRVHEDGVPEEGEGDDEEEEEDGDDDDDDDRSVREPPKFADANLGASLAATKSRVAEEIQARNMFCPTCAPIDPAPEPPPSLDQLGRPNGIQPGEVKSTLPLKLVATWLATDNGSSSFATIYDVDGAFAGAYRRGDSPRPAVTIVAVNTGIVHLRNNAQLEYITVSDEAKPTPKKPKNAAKDDDKPGEQPSPSPYAIEGAQEAINCPSENSCTVDRSFVESLMSNPAALAKQARMSPIQKDGETQGFKFYGIQRGSLPKLLGLKNGDMLTGVNGEDVKSLDQAISLATKLRRAKNLSVTLVRKGKPLTKEITIQ